MLGTLVSLFLSANPVGGLPQIKKFYVLLTLPVVYTALRGQRIHRRLLAAWGAAAVAAAGVSFVQFALKYIAARQAGEAFYPYYVVQRTTGFMSHWMTFGGLQMMVFLMLAAYAFWPSGGANSRWYAAAGAAIVGGSIVIGLTRGVWMGCFLGGLYLIWCWKKKWLLMVPVVALVVVVASPDAVRERLHSFVAPQGNLDSNQFRIVTARTGIEMIKAHPWFGVGPMRVGPEFRQFVPADIPRPLPVGYYEHLHNIYLQYAAERGLPTMLAMMWMLGMILLDFHRALRRAGPPAGDVVWVLRGAIAAIVAILVEGMVEYNLGDSEVLFLFLVIVCCGYLVMEQRARPLEYAGVAVSAKPPTPDFSAGAAIPLDEEGGNG